MKQNRIDIIIDELKEELNSQMIEESHKLKKFPRLLTELEDYLIRFEQIMMKMEYNLSVLNGVINNQYSSENVKNMYLKEQLLTYDIKSLGLVQKTINLLYAANIYTINDLINRTEKDLLKTAKISKARLSEIKNELAEIGFKLKLDDD